MLRRHLCLSVALAAISFDAARAADGALAYAPAEATLSGTLAWHGGVASLIDAAAPHDADSDITLLLSTPVCAVADPVWLDTHSDVSVIRLVLARAQYDALAGSVGTPVTLRGRLLPQLSPRHHAALYLADVQAVSAH